MRLSFPRGLLAIHSTITPQHPSPRPLWEGAGGRGAAALVISMETEMFLRFPAALIATTLTVFAAASSAQTLTLAAAAAPTSVDPHYHTFGPNGSLDIHIFDYLVDMDPQSHPIPALALSWKLVDDRTWEFKLR